MESRKAIMESRKTINAIILGIIKRLRRGSISELQQIDRYVKHYIP